MKSNKQRRTEIKARRELRAAADRAAHRPNPVPSADGAKYVDQAYRCRDCGTETVWTAAEQRWWFDQLQKPRWTCAVRCLPCRRQRRVQKASLGEEALRLRTLCRELEALGSLAPSPAARQSLEAALGSKWQGVRVIAAKAMCRWRDAQSLARVRVAAAAERERFGLWTAAWAMEYALRTAEAAGNSPSRASTKRAGDRGTAHASGSAMRRLGRRDLRTLKEEEDS